MSEPQQLIPVTYRADPFHPENVRTFEIWPGTTLFDVVIQVIPEEVHDCIVVCVNGTRVEREWWRRVRPKLGTVERPTIVTFHPLPMTDTDIGKIALVLAAVALVAVVAVVSGPL